MFHWLVHTDAGLFARILAGCAVFAALALVDLRRRGRHARRWREYGVLLGSVIAALLYGAINDQITVTISPEYFLYGKELYKTIGEDPPPAALRCEAAKVGLKATWSAGLIFGVALLIANNPFRSLPRLSNRRLLLYLPLIVLTAAACGVVGGWLGYRGHLTGLDSDFSDLIDANMYRPYRFMAAWGVHLGGYAGGLVGTIVAAVLIWNVRRRLLGKGLSDAV